MAATKVKSVLAGKLGAKLTKAVQAHADDDTTYGIINLPGGISNGIAQLSKCYFKEFGAESNMKKADGTSAKGEFYFRAEGTVVSPSSVPTPDGIVPVKGLVTSIMVPLVETKNTAGDVSTLEDAVQRILNIMRQLAGQEYTKGATGEDLESLASGLEEGAPYFRFSTSQGKASEKFPTPRVFENWHGNKGLENYQPPEDVAFNETATPAPSANGKVTSPQQPEKRVDAITPVGEMDLDDLVALASSEADTAQEAKEALEAKAVEVGWTQEEVDAADNWEAVKEMIETPKTDDTPDSTPPAPPVKGQTCKYSPPNKKKAGSVLTERECQITTVNAKNEMVTLKDLTTKPPTEYKDVAWSELS